MTSSYSRFGTENPLTPDAIDPVSQCVGNIMFTKTGIPGYQMQDDFCPRFMAQRCSVNWDPYCEAYMSESNVDSGGFVHINKGFLNEAAKKKYCHLSNAPGTHCAKKCESFLPEGQSSVQICENIGTQNWLDTREEFDLGGNFPQSARLNPISPLYMSYCPEVCDASGLPAGSLGPNDPILNNCIKYGACSQILMDLAYNVVKNNTPVTNPAFKLFVDQAKQDKPVNPNMISKIALANGIPPEVALEVLANAKYGANQPLKPPMNISMPSGKLSVAPVAKGVVSPVAKGVVSPMAKKEGYYPPQKININKNTLILGGIGLVVLAIILYFLYMKRKH